MFTLSEVVFIPHNKTSSYVHLLTSEAVPDGDKVSLPECHLHKKLASTDPDKLTQRYLETKHVF